METLIKKVRNTIGKYKMIQPGDRILVGVSGGMDSVTLLYILQGLRKELNFIIHIGHLDHKFRGEESRQDRVFVENLAEKMDLPFSYDEVDVPAIIREKDISPEEAARIARYEFFERVVKQNSLNKVAVAHTKDDQAETVLMRLIKGTGILGLTGISPYKDLKGLIIIRPFIETWRSEIDEFVKAQALEFRQDSSNLESVFFRNKIRHNLLPYLEKEFNPNIKEILVNLAENLRAEADFLERFGERKFRGTSGFRDQKIRIDLKKFLRQHEAVQRRIIRSAIKALKGDLRKISFQHWKEIEELIKDRPINSIADLPSGLSFLKKKNEIVCFLK